MNKLKLLFESRKVSRYIRRMRKNGFVSAGKARYTVMPSLHVQQP